MAEEKTKENDGIRRDATRRLAVVTGATLAWAALLFLAAGTMDWIRGWVYMALTVFGIAANGALIMRYNPQLAAERGRRRKDTQTFDKYVAAAYAPALFILPVVAGLDAVRYGWSSMPLATLYIGAVLFVLGSVPVAWSMAVNPHLETTVRIQTDRDHKVVSRGPYRLVRHPMYLGSIVMHLAAPLTLGSWWAFAPAGVLVVTLVVRTIFEDSALIDGLPGYREFASRTRFRLVPGIW